MHALQLEMCGMCAFHYARKRRFPLKSVSISGIGDSRLSTKTYEMCAFQVEMRTFHRKTLTRYGNSLVCTCYWVILNRNLLLIIEYPNME